VNLLSTVLKASDHLNGLVEDFKIFNSGSIKLGMESGADERDMEMMRELRGHK
jgi:hypothetical protein